MVCDVANDAEVVAHIDLLGAGSNESHDIWGFMGYPELVSILQYARLSAQQITCDRSSS